MNKSPALLGFAGLIPFIGLPLAIVFKQLSFYEGMLYFSQYSAIILSFLGGIHWYDAIQRQAHSEQIYLAMLPSIVAWVALVLLAPVSIIWVLAVAFVAVVLYDFKVLQPPKGYMNMRVRLTSIVLGCHGVMLWLYYARL